MKNKKRKTQIKSHRNNIMNKFSLIVSITEPSSQIEVLKNILTQFKHKNSLLLELILVTNINLKEDERKSILSELRSKTDLQIRFEVENLDFNFNNSLKEAKASFIGILNLQNLNKPFNLNFLSKIDYRSASDDSLILLNNQNNKQKRKIIFNKPFLFLNKNKAVEISNISHILKIDFYKALSLFKDYLKLKIENIFIGPDSSYVPEMHKVTIVNKLTQPFVRFFYWFLKLPLLDLKERKQFKIGINKEPAIFRLLFVLTISIMFFIMPFMAYNAGISGDENVNYRHAKYVLNYYRTNGKDKAALNTPKTKLQYYGQSFDNLTALVNETFNIEKVYESRHIFNALTGWITILFAGLLAAIIGGWRVGLLSILFLFFSPRFLGHSFNNPKDIPFAMAYIFSLYCMVKFLQNLPQLKIKTLILLTISIGISISVRIGGLLLIAYLFTFTGLYFLFTIQLRNIFKNKNIGFILKIIAILSLISIVGYFIGLIFWPYALQDPLKNPFKALKEMTNFSASLRQLFEGKIIWSDSVPWYYTLKYIIITIPLATIFGFIVYLFFALPNEKKLNLLYNFILIFAFVFPVIYIIYKKSNLYGGWRHLIFSYPTFVILAAIGYNFILKSLKNKRVLIIGYIFLLGLFFLPIKHTITNHPHQYVYYNQLVGGVKGAYGNYEMDYYYHSLKAASEWLIKNEINSLEKNPEKKIIVATNHALTSHYFESIKEYVKVQYVRYYQRGNHNWDYAVIANSYINPYQLKEDIWPPKNTIHTIRVDKKPICAILKREDNNDFLGFEAFKKGDIRSAEKHFKKAIDYNPNNEIALLNLSDLYRRTNRYNEALNTVAQLLKTYPDYDKALNQAGLIYLQKKDIANATNAFQRAIYVNSKYSTGYYYLGYINLYFNKNLQEAFTYTKKAISANRRNKSAYLLMAEIYKTKGDHKMAERIIQQANKIK